MGDGEPSPFVMKNIGEEFMSTVKALIHITREGERWDTIAWHYYGSPIAYGPLIEINRAAPIMPQLPAGLRLVIPILTTDQVTAQHVNQNLPPWKQ
jgi:phage tail protein X